MTFEIDHWNKTAYQKDGGEILKSDEFATNYFIVDDICEDNINDSKELNEEHTKHVNLMIINNIKTMVSDRKVIYNIFRSYEGEIRLDIKQGTETNIYYLLDTWI